MTTLKAFDVAGEEVHPGDLVIDFRGEKAIFECATRAPSPGRAGKVRVKIGEATREFYDSVFGLVVREEE